MLHSKRIHPNANHFGAAEDDVKLRDERCLILVTIGTGVNENRGQAALDKFALYVH
jgi:hypothetical protein